MFFFLAKILRQLGVQDQIAISFCQSVYLLRLPRHDHRSTSKTVGHAYLLYTVTFHSSAARFLKAVLHNLLP